MPLFEPLVSIVLPAFNAENFIVRTINSVLEQSYTNWELIIVNDGSSDGTVNQIKNIADDRVLLINQTNQGVSAARNTGLQHMRGELFCFLDADDLLPTSSLELRVCEFASHDDLDILISHLEEVDTDTGRKIEVLKPKLFADYPRAIATLQQGAHPAQPSMFASRLKGVSFQPGWTHCEDMAYYFQTFNNARVELLPKVTYTYCRRRGSAMDDTRGLVMGYLNFMQLTQAKLNLRDRFIQRIKIMKIVALTCLSRREFLLAIKSSARVLLP